MVLLGAAIISKSGKVIVDGQYGYLPPNRLEELFEFFLKKVKSEEQKTTANVLYMNNLRFAYQPFETVYALLVTYKQDDIYDDMDRLSLLSQVVQEFYSPGDEDGPCELFSEISSAFERVMTVVHSQAITIDDVKQYVKKYHCSSAAVSTLPSAIKSRSCAPPLTDPITVMIEENVKAILERDGLKCNFEVHGTLSLQLLNWKAGLIELQIESGDHPDIKYEMHPIIDKKWFLSDKVLLADNPDVPLPAVGSPFGDGIDHLLSWGLQSEDMSVLPLKINCCPCVNGDKTYLSIGYDASDMSVLQNVVISVPLPDLRDAPHVTQIDGEWRSRNPVVFSWPYLVGSEVLKGLIRWYDKIHRYDSKNSVLEWSIDLIDKSNRSGSLEFVVPTADTEAFFPIHARFSSTSTFSHIKVVDVVPIKDEVAPKFSQRMQMVADCYKVV